MKRLYAAEIATCSDTHVIFVVCRSAKRAHQKVEWFCKDYQIPYATITVTPYVETKTHRIVIGSSKENREAQMEHLYCVRFDDVEQSKRYMHMIVGMNEEDVRLQLNEEYPLIDFDKNHTYECRLIEVVNQHPIYLTNKRNCSQQIGTHFWEKVRQLLMPKTYLKKNG